MQFLKQHCFSKLSWFDLKKVLEAQMKADLADKENLEARRAQQEEESRENSKLISEQKAVSLICVNFFTMSISYI